MAAVTPPAATLAGKRVLLIVSGGIAAYKALELIRLLRQAGCAVTCVLTASGAQFVTTLSLQATLMFFFVFLILVVVCEYVGRILAEAQDRPLYHVLEERNSSLLEMQQQRNVLDRSA